MFKDFKAFVNQGNAMDLAVGVVIGAAFGKIVDSVVNDIVMPLISLATGGVDFSQRFIALSGQGGATLEEARKAGAVLAYGNFIQTVFNFLVIAFSIFLVVRQINKMRAGK
ncbi:MAG: large conductance mechanosensitive channel protein MscL [Acidobacteria bacterium]|nr:MAG: large conductance mechanosensitive channel protein MscL [Acidobacteriota bacterium]